MKAGKRYSWPFSRWGAQVLQGEQRRVVVERKTLNDLIGRSPSNIHWDQLGALDGEVGGAAWVVQWLHERHRGAIRQYWKQF